MGKNVAVFVDVANIFYAAKAAGVDIDYVTLLKAAVAGRDFVRAYAYTGLDPENENQRNFHSFLARHGYKVVSKDIRKYGDGKVKANLDIELVVDMMKTARNLDVAIVVSGDGDFAPAIRAVQEMGVRVEVISFRGNTSSDLIDVADVFTDITQIARVDRDSQRSGRRVAEEEEDLSMTEVPDKQTEGRGGRRGRGRGRGGEREAAATGRGGQRSGGRAVAASGNGAAGPRDGARMVVLPGEKLSRVQGGETEAEPVEELGEELVGEASADVTGQVEETDAGGDQGRRRRRRGGRGRGHGGRGRDEVVAEAAPSEEAVVEEGEPATLPVLPTTSPNPFGSVWDSQIGMVGRPTADLPPIPAEEDDFAEPEIPEYLLAERRRGRGGRGGGGGRGGARSAYASAMERERFGRTRFQEPPRQPQPPRRREERPQRQPQPQPQRGQNRGGGGGGGRPSSEPWSEVPPELEELLRAQLAGKMSRPAEAETASGIAEAQADEAEAEVLATPDAGETGLGAVAPVQVPAEEGAAPARGRGRRGTARAVVADATPVAEEPSAETPRRRTGGRRKAAEPETPAVPTAVEPAAEAPKRRVTRRRVADAVSEAAAGTAETSADAVAAEAGAEAPKRRGGRRKAAEAETPAVEASADAAGAEAPKRRGGRRKATAEAGGEGA